jgi:hypothetical protein
VEKPTRKGDYRTKLLSKRNTKLFFDVLPGKTPTNNSLHEAVTIEIHPYTLPLVSYSAARDGLFFSSTQGFESPQHFY